jgi:hypothetical protein
MFDCIGGCGKQVAVSGTKCIHCMFGGKAVVKPTDQGPKQVTVEWKPQMPVNHVVQQVPVPVPVFNPNTLPVNSNLRVKAARQGELVFTELDPANRLYVLQGTTIEFRAAQVGASPQQGPLINFSTTAWSGTSGAAGAGSSKLVRFDNTSISNNDPGAQTVILGFGGQTVTIRCVVFSLTHTMVIGDPFVGRSTANFGVDERLTLGFNTVPAGVTALEIGGLRWSVASPGRNDDGLLHNPATHAAPVLPNGLAEYVAPCRTNTGQLSQKTRHVQLRLRVDSGLCTGLGANVEITIWSPSMHMRLGVGNHRHSQYVPSAGFWGQIFLSPKNVSFSTLSFQEGTGAIRTYGFRNDAEDGITQHAATGANIAISTGNINNGCQVVGVLDDVFSGNVPGHVVPTPAYDIVVGKETWPIYWEYTYRDLVTNLWTNPWIRTQIAYHVATLYQTGRMTMFKGHIDCAEDLCNAEVSIGLNEGTVP